MSCTYYENIGIKHMYILDLVYIPEEPIHIGAYQEGITKKYLLFKVQNEDVPIIPSESFKGVLRHLATRIAKKIFENSPEVGKIVECHKKDLHIKGCDKQFDDEIVDAYNFFSSNKIFPRDKLSRMIEEDAESLLEIYLSLKCPICYLFGSKKLASKLIFTDFIFEPTPSLHLYTATSIDRRNRRVAEDKLYQLEYVPPSNKNRIRGRIIVDNVEPGSPPALLLASILQYIASEGLLVGGSKSRGYGLIRLTNESKAYVLDINFSPKNLDDIISNVKAILLKEEKIKKLDIKDFIEYLKPK